MEEIGRVVVLVLVPTTISEGSRARVSQPGPWIWVGGEERKIEFGLSDRAGDTYSSGRLNEEPGIRMRRREKRMMWR